jgi:hypothetical protein
MIDFLHKITEVNLMVKKLSPEVEAAIIKVAGKWALGVATAPSQNINTKQLEYNPPDDIPDELQSEFKSSYEFLIEYLGYSPE